MEHAAFGQLAPRTLHCGAGEGASPPRTETSSAPDASALSKTVREDQQERLHRYRSYCRGSEPANEALCLDLVRVNRPWPAVSESV
jgi:hypothetical protein